MRRAFAASCCSYANAVRLLHCGAVVVVVALLNEDVGGVESLARGTLFSASAAPTAAPPHPSSAGCCWGAVPPPLLVPRSREVDVVGVDTSAVVEGSGDDEAEAEESCEEDVGGEGSGWAGTPSSH